LVGGVCLDGSIASALHLHLRALSVGKHFASDDIHHTTHRIRAVIE
jgi:hypothetical protein